MLPSYLWSSLIIRSNKKKPYLVGYSLSYLPLQLARSGTFYSETLFLRLVLFFALYLPISISSHAIELFDNVQVHGFASQTMFLTSGNNMFGPSISNPSFDFTELGINGSWSPLSNLRLSMQVLSRRAGKGNDGSPVIDFGLMDYSLPFEADYRIGIRAGRVRIPYGIYNDTRDVAFTRPSILLPQSIYFEGTRDFTISSDGLLVYGESRKPWGNLTLELFGGYSRSNEMNPEFSFLSLTGNLEPNLGFSGRLNYETYDGSLRFALSGAYIPMEYKSGSPFSIGPTGTLIPKPTNGKLTFTPMLLSAQYNADKLTLTSEFSPFFIHTSGLNTIANSLADFNNFAQSYYFQAAYRFAPQWELMARYDAMYTNSHDQSGKQTEGKYQSQISRLINSNALGELNAQQAYDLLRQAPHAYSQFAKTLTVGLRYDISPMMMIRVEYNYINGTAWLPTQGNPNQSETKQYWDMFGAQVSIRF